MTPDQKKIARHTLGLDTPAARGKSYRNGYVVGVPGPAMEELEIMCRAGEAVGRRQGQSMVYSLTKKGAVLALNPGEMLDPEDFP